MKFSRRHQADFAHHFRAGDCSFEHRFAAGAYFFAGSQRGRRGHAPGVHDGLFQGIVIIETMSQRAIGEHRVGRGHFYRRTDQAALRRAAKLFCDIQNHPAKIHG